MRANIQIGQFNAILFMQNALGLQKKEPPVGSMKTSSQQVDSLSISYALFTHFSRIGTDTDILLHFSKVEKCLKNQRFIVFYLFSGFGAELPSTQRFRVSYIFTSPCISIYFLFTKIHFSAFSHCWVKIVQNQISAMKKRCLLHRRILYNCYIFIYYIIQLVNSQYMFHPSFSFFFSQIMRGAQFNDMHPVL